MRHLKWLFLFCTLVISVQLFAEASHTLRLEFYNSFDDDELYVRMHPGSGCIIEGFDGGKLAPWGLETAHINSKNQQRCDLTIGIAKSLHSSAIATLHLVPKASSSGFELRSQVVGKSCRLKTSSKEWSAEANKTIGVVIEP